MRRTISRFAFPLAAAALLAAGCAGTEPPPRPAAAEPAASGDGAVAEGDGFRATAEAESIEVGRVFQELDRRTDEYVFLGAQAGEDVRERRALVESALEATVAQYLPKILSAAVDTSDPARRRTAVKALAFTRDPRAIAPLTRALSTPGDVRLLTGATFALARIASPATPIPPLLDAAKDGDADVRSNALLALWNVFDARREANAPPLEGALVASALGAIEPSLFDMGDPIVRGNAAAALGALGDPRGTDSLINLLRDQHPFVRTHTALALGKLGDRRAIGPLVEVIDETPAGTPRSAVLLGITLLMEKEGHAAPTNLGNDERVWRSWVGRTLGPSGRSERN